MGAEADAVVFSPRHLYLALTALVCAGLALREIRLVRAQANGQHDFKRVITLGLQALPLRGWRFYLATATLQCTVGIASALGEGCFFCGHDVIAALLGAVSSALLLALIARALARRLPSLASAIIQFVQAEIPSSHRAWTRRNSLVGGFERSYWFEALFNRPPPALQFS